MRNRHISFLPSIQRILFTSALLLVMYFAGIALWRGLTSLKSELAVAIIAAAATVTVAVLSSVISKRLDARAAIRQEMRTKKIPIYEGIISTLFKMLYAEKMGEEPMSEPELVRFFASSTEQMVIWGSDDVIREYRAFRMYFVELANNGASNTPTDSTMGMFRFEDLLLAIRRDLGHKNVGFRRGTVLGLWVNDIDTYL